MLSGDGGKVYANIVVYVCYITLDFGMYFGCRLCCSHGCIHECGIRIWQVGGGLCVCVCLVSLICFGLKLVC